MTIERIPGEFRWWVSSESRPIKHVVDLTNQEERWSKPRPLCGCEDSFAKGNICKHIIAATQNECERLGFLVLAGGRGVLLRKTTNELLKQV